MTYFLFIISFILISFYFYQKQNKKKSIGGKIALAKLFWLDYTLITWFFLPLFFYFENNASLVILPWFVLSLSMWIRGIVELYMLYVSKNWSPIIGISHDVLTLLLVIIFSFKVESQLFIDYLMVASLVFSLVLETYYATAFYQIMKGKTQGDEAIWFVSQEEPRFKRVLKITSFGNIILYAVLFIWLFVKFKP